MQNRIKIKIQINLIKFFNNTRNVCNIIKIWQTTRMMNLLIL